MQQRAAKSCSTLFKLFESLKKQNMLVCGVVHLPYIIVHIIICTFIIIKVGQIQLIRRQIAHELNRTSKFDSKLLCNALQTFNA